MTDLRASLDLRPDLAAILVDREEQARLDSELDLDLRRVEVEFGPEMARLDVEFGTSGISRREAIRRGWAS